MSFIGFIVAVVIAIFLAVDAPKHDRSGWLWGILGFFFGLIPLGIYLVLTKRTALGIIALCVWGFAILCVIIASIAMAFASPAIVATPL